MRTREMVFGVLLLLLALTGCKGKHDSFKAGEDASLQRDMTANYAAENLLSGRGSYFNDLLLDYVSLDDGDTQYMSRNYYDHFLLGTNASSLLHSAVSYVTRNPFWPMERNFPSLADGDTLEIYSYCIDCANGDTLYVYSDTVSEWSDTVGYIVACDGGTENQNAAKIIRGYMTIYPPADLSGVTVELSGCGTKYPTFSFKMFPPSDGNTVGTLHRLVIDTYWQRVEATLIPGEDPVEGSTIFPILLTDLTKSNPIKYIWPGERTSYIRQTTGEGKPAILSTNMGHTPGESVTLQSEERPTLYTHEALGNIYVAIFHEYSSGCYEPLIGTWAIHSLLGLYDPVTGKWEYQYSDDLTLELTAGEKYALFLKTEGYYGEMWGQNVDGPLQKMTAGLDSGKIPLDCSEGGSSCNGNQTGRTPIAAYYVMGGSTCDINDINKNVSGYPWYFQMPE